MPTDPERTALHRRLKAWGYVAVQVDGVRGWIPAAFGERVVEQIETHAEDVAKISAGRSRPQGRPKKLDIIP